MCLFRRRHGRRFNPELTILHRPDIVRDRKQLGHWECDLIQFRKKFGKANVTSLVERVSRFTVFLRNNDRQSRAIMDGLIDVLGPLPIPPADQSPSIAAPTSQTGPTFRPVSAFRHGSAIRRHRGRKARWKTPTAALANGSRETPIHYRSRSRPAPGMRPSNSTPRKCLGFRTPAEVFRQKIPSVNRALTCLAAKSHFSWNSQGLVARPRLDMATYPRQLPIL